MVVYITLTRWDSSFMLQDFGFSKSTVTFAQTALVFSLFVRVGSPPFSPVHWSVVGCENSITLLSSHLSFIFRVAWIVHMEKFNTYEDISQVNCYTSEVCSQEVMKSVGSNGSQLMPFMVIVMVWYFVGDTGKVMTELILSSCCACSGFSGTDTMVTYKVFFEHPVQSDA